MTGPTSVRTGDGGYLADHEVVGEQAGRLALRVLAGERPEDVHATNATLTPMVDWRAIEHWKINPARLPPGAAIRFRTPTAWDQYRGYIVGGVTLLVLQALMITALVVQRSRRREVEARNAAMLSAVPDAMFLLTKDGIYIDYHASDQAQLVEQLGAFLGRHISEVLPPAVATAFTTAFARLEREPGPIVLEYSWSLPDGERRITKRAWRRAAPTKCWPWSVTSPSRGSRCTSFTRHRPTYASARITALGELASIAHEIRQPLTGILVNTKTCLRWLSGSQPDLSEVRDALSDVVEAGQRANGIIRRNRELFRHHTVQMTALDVNSVIREVEELARSRLQTARVSLVTSMMADVPPGDGDRVELQQVLLNLIGNSIDAVENIERHARRVEVSSSLAVDGSVKVAVRDTGVGLAGVDRERMFALAYTTKASGSGVGLSISRSIIEAHGGRLWLSRTPTAAQPSGSLSPCIRPQAQHHSSRPHTTAGLPVIVPAV